MNSEEKIGFKERFGYGLGDLASNLFWMQFVWYLSYFYTDVYGLAPAALATMIFFVRIWDSVIDPITGIISDRTQTRWGKFRPYLLFGAVPFGIAGSLMFITPDFSATGKLVYAYVTYSFMVIVYTAVNIPYSSLMGVVSADPATRTSFSQMRFFMAFMGGLIVQATTLPMVSGFGADDFSVIKAEVTADVLRVQEKGNGSSRVEISAFSDVYEKPGVWTSLWRRVSGDEQVEGKTTVRQTIYVNTHDYYEEAGIAYDVETDPGETIAYLPSGFGDYTIDIDAIFEAQAGMVPHDLERRDLAVTVINEQKGFQSAMIVFSIAAAALFFATFSMTKERVDPPKDQKTSVKQDILDLLGNKPWLILFALGIITLFHVCIRNGAIIYYFKYNVGNTEIIPMFMMAGTLASIVAVLGIGYFSSRLGKRRCYTFLMLFTVVFTFGFYFVPETNIQLLFLFHVLISLSFAPTSVLIWSMYTDVVDYSEWKTGRRATGLIISACTIAQNLGYTIGGAAGMGLLGYIGYQANAVQTPETLSGIKGMVSWISAIPCVIGLGLVMIYPLTKEKLETIAGDLMKRRAGAA